MRPVIFDYAIPQRDDENSTLLEYDYSIDVGKVNGRTIFDNSDELISTVTKTKVQRESDDSPMNALFSSVTKTNTLRETDDTNINSFTSLLTKTDTVRESDDSNTSYLAMLTKTEQKRERDE